MRSAKASWRWLCWLGVQGAMQMLVGRARRNADAERVKCRPRGVHPPWRSSWPVRRWGGRGGGGEGWSCEERCLQVHNGLETSTHTTRTRPSPACQYPPLPWHPSLSQATDPPPWVTLPSEPPMHAHAHTHTRARIMCACMASLPKPSHRAAPLGDAPLPTTHTRAHTHTHTHTHSPPPHTHAPPRPAPPRPAPPHQATDLHPWVTHVHTHGMRGNFR